MHEGHKKHTKLHYMEKRNTCVTFWIPCSVNTSIWLQPPHRFNHRDPAHLKTFATITILKYILLMYTEIHARYLNV